ncbi:MAG: Lrp/AsnC ligand binding domain-containing protein [Dehalococcoidales bacterium]
MKVAAKAFVLIETAVGRTREVAKALEKLGGVDSVDMVTGPYDLIVVIERDKLADIGDMVTGKIHTVSGISRTVTCLVV